MRVAFLIVIANATNVPQIYLISKEMSRFTVHDFLNGQHDRYIVRLNCNLNILHK
jgi:hypothetical protein